MIFYDIINKLVHSNFPETLLQYRHNELINHATNKILICYSFQILDIEERVQEYVKPYSLQTDGTTKSALFNAINSTVMTAAV